MPVLKPLLVIGSSNCDMIMKVDRLPAVGETVIGATYVDTCGGKGANSAVGAARAGGNVLFANCVGDDSTADKIRKTLKSYGVDISLLHTIEGEHSGHALIMVGEHGANYITVAGGANMLMPVDYVQSLRPQIEASARVLLQNEISLEANLEAMKIAKECGVPVSFNFAPVVDFPVEALKGLDILIVNETEAMALLRMAGLEEGTDVAAAQRLRSLGIEHVLITLGADGVTVVGPQGDAHIPAHKVEAIDTTAAGDIFCGCFGVGLCEGLDILDAVRFAMGGAALSVTRTGCMMSAASREEIDEFLETVASS